MNESLGRIVEWAKKNPALAALIVGGVVVLAYFATKGQGAGESSVTEEDTSGGAGVGIGDTAGMEAFTTPPMEGYPTTGYATPAVSSSVVSSGNGSESWSEEVIEYPGEVIEAEIAPVDTSPAIDKSVTSHLQDITDVQAGTPEAGIVARAQTAEALGPLGMTGYMVGAQVAEQGYGLGERIATWLKSLFGGGAGQGASATVQGSALGSAAQTQTPSVGASQTTRSLSAAFASLSPGTGTAARVAPGAATARQTPTKATASINAIEQQRQRQTPAKATASINAIEQQRQQQTRQQALSRMAALAAKSERM